MGIKKLWKYMYFFIIMLPIGSSSYSWLNFMQNQYGVTWLDFAYVILMLITLLFYRNRIRITKDNVIILMIVIIAFFNIFFTIHKGYKVYGYSAIRDSFNYIMCIVYLISSYKINREIFSYSSLIDLTESGYIGYSLITLITNAFLSEGVRIGANCFSLSVMLVPYEIYKCISTTRIKKKSIILIGCFVINSILSQNRTGIILSIISSLIATIIALKETKTKKTFKRVMLISTVSLLIIVTLYFFKNQEMNRILKGGDIDTFGGRVTTFNYYFELIKNKPSGDGFGYVMHFFTAGNHELNSGTFQIDNALIVYAIKGGILMAIIYTFLALLPLFNNSSFWNEKERKIFLWTYPFLIVSTYLMTSQIIQGRAIAAFVWTIVGVSVRNIFHNAENR